jgi:hypothetical protein
MGRLLCHFRRVTFHGHDFSSKGDRSYFTIEMDFSKPRDRVLVGVDTGDWAGDETIRSRLYEVY